jgi:hypothetical protein
MAPIFRRKPSKKPAWSRQQPSSNAWYLLHFGFLLGLFFGPEEGVGMFFRNVG